ncbi:MAG: GTPase Era [Ignavibacteria bacterium]|nr:GTPase Era [Ignavibacteria bacterium]MCA0387799.1 GTPase Era [Bacteroidota bacterium]
MTTKAGYVTILGAPNAGKSTLMNALLGEKISITTSKPQTTRKRVLGILSEENYQIIFLDTPGILEPRYKLQEKMMDYVNISLQDADIIVWLHDAQAPPLEEEDSAIGQIFKLVKKVNVPKIACVNKIDIDEKKTIESIEYFEGTKKFDKVVPISALASVNLQMIKEFFIEHLPEHPKYYPEDDLSDENERFFVSEIIRENIFELYEKEIPYSCEVVIEEFKEREGRKDFIAAMIYVERDSQAGIIIGKKGSMIKKLGEKSRAGIESFLDREVYLDIRVKVRSNWRSDDRYLKYFGYSTDDGD